MKIKRNMIDENNFIPCLQRQEEAAMTYLIDQYGSLVKGVVYRHLTNFPHLREECLNDIFLAVWLHAKDYDPQKNSFKNWLCAVAQYKCIDCKRHWGKDLLAQELTEELLPTTTGTESQILATELSEETDALLAKLSPADRSYFEQYYLEDKTIPEIAQAAQVREAVVYNHLSRGRTKLRLLEPKKQEKREGVQNHENPLSDVK